MRGEPAGVTFPRGDSIPVYNPGIRIARGG
jgi:hypothetical protein